MVEKDVTGLLLTDGAGGFLPSVLACLGMRKTRIRVEAPAPSGLMADQAAGAA